jgi:hypothetical protein
MEEVASMIPHLTKLMVERRTQAPEAEEEAEETDPVAKDASSVVKRVTCPENAQTEEARTEEVGEAEHASNVEKKDICLENALILVHLATVQAEVEAAAEPVSSVERKAI